MRPSRAAVLLLTLMALTLTACAPGQDVDASVKTYCADLCFADPTWLHETEDPWDCTLECEQDPAISQSMLSCLGEEGADPEGIEICELLLGVSFRE